jgi:uncharacterized protein YukE
MKLNSAFSKILTNKWVLNIVSIIALFNVIGYMVIGDYNIVLYFIILAILVRYFSKNMIVVLGIPLIIINMISLKGNSYVEGMENIEEKTKETKKEFIDKDKIKETNIESTVEPKKTNDESFEVGRPKGGKYKIDYASTIEDAYDQLNSILGKDGIKSLTEDTQRLLKQQTELAGSLKDMGPMIKQMAPMVESLNSMTAGMKDGSGGDLMKNVQSMMTSLNKASTDTKK